MYPNDFRYTKDHEWIKVEGDEAVVGITDFAQHQLGDIIYVELPAVGKELAARQSIGVVESVKSVSDVYAPVPGVGHGRQRGARPDGRPPQQGPPRPGLDRPDQDQGQEGPRRPPDGRRLREIPGGARALRPARPTGGFAMSYLSLSDKDKKEMLARTGVGVGRRPLLLHPRGRPPQAAARPARGPVRARARPDDRARSAGRTPTAAICPSSAAGPTITSSRRSSIT